MTGKDGLKCAEAVPIYYHPRWIRGAQGFRGSEATPHRHDTASLMAHDS